MLTTVSSAGSFLHTQVWHDTRPTGSLTQRFTAGAPQGSTGRTGGARSGACRRTRCPRARSGPPASRPERHRPGRTARTPRAAATREPRRPHRSSWRHQMSPGNQLAVRSLSSDSSDVADAHRGSPGSAPHWHAAARDAKPSWLPLQAACRCELTAQQCCHSALPLDPTGLPGVQLPCGCGHSARRCLSCLGDGSCHDGLSRSSVIAAVSRVHASADRPCSCRLTRSTAAQRPLTGCGGTLGSEGCRDIRATCMCALLESIAVARERVHAGRATVCYERASPRCGLGRDNARMSVSCNIAYVRDPMPSETIEGTNRSWPSSSMGTLR